MKIPNQVVYKNKTFKLNITPKELDEAVSRIAGQINEDYSDKTPLFLVVLKGAVFFASDLLRKLTIHCTLETITAKSYGNELYSSGVVNLNLDDLPLKGRDVIIIEDIVDSGLTLQSIINKLKKQDPESIEAAAIVSKPDQRTVDVRVKYIGIEIPADFVIGYGMDYAEYGRHLPGIYSLIEN